MNPIAALKLAAFIVGLLIEYGPTLVQFGQKVYRKVEGIYGDHATHPDPEKRANSKRLAFKDLVQADRRTWERTMGFPPVDRPVDEFREKIWARENWRKKTMRDKLAKKPPGRGGK